MSKNQGNTRGPRADNASPEGGQTTGADDRDDFFPATADGLARLEAKRAADRKKAPDREAIMKREPKQYRATARGTTFEGDLIEPDQVFSTRGDQGSWMEPVGKSSGKEARLEEAVDDMSATKKDDPDLSTFSLQALQAEALRLGLTDATGLSQKDLITAINAAYVNEAQ